MSTVDLLGRRYGKLLVVEKTQQRQSGSVLWRCVCDCGEERLASTRHLNRNPDTNNVVRSCGCLVYKSGSEHKDWNGVGDISGHWWARITRVSNRKSRAALVVTITKEQAWDLFLQQERKCALTGLTLRISDESSANTASIDRIDSNKGYTLENVQWVHKDINMMKRNYAQAYFVTLCTMVGNHNG